MTSLLINKISACFLYQTKAIESTIVLISHIPDYVGTERLETKQIEKYLSDILSDHCKMGVVLLKCGYFENQNIYVCMHTE
jgi:hypothetical protein